MTSYLYGQAAALLVYGGRCSPRWQRYRANKSRQPSNLNDKRPAFAETVNYVAITTVPRSRIYERVVLGLSRPHSLPLLVSKFLLFNPIAAVD